MLKLSDIWIMDLLWWNFEVLKQCMDTHSYYCKFILRAEKVVEEVAIIELEVEKQNLPPNESQPPSPSSQDQKWDPISLPFFASLNPQS